MKHMDLWILNIKKLFADQNFYWHKDVCCENNKSYYAIQLLTGDHATCQYDQDIQSIEKKSLKETSV